MVCIAYTKQFLFKTFFPIIHIFLEIFQQFEKLDIFVNTFSTDCTISLQSLSILIIEKNF